MAKVLGVPETIARFHNVRLLGYGQAEGGAIGQAAVKAACLASGGTWNETLGKCIAKMAPIVIPTVQPSAQAACIQAGGIWSTQENACLPAEQKASASLAGPILIAGLAAVVGWFLVRRKR